MAIADLAARGLNPAETPEDYEAAWPSALEKATDAVKAEHDEVVELGGLYVLGTERHESRRIDNQLRGRSGRQGDPGESRFYLSLQDELMRLFKSDWVDRVLTVLKIPDDVFLRIRDNECWFGPHPVDFLTCTPRWRAMRVEDFGHTRVFIPDSAPCSEVGTDLTDPVYVPV